MNQKIRRVNVFGGPGLGKSTLAAKLFAELKIKSYDVEHISEFIKTWAHAGRIPESFDQHYVFAKQLHAEDMALRNVKLIVTDSPLLLNCAYGRFYGFHPYLEMIAIAKHFDEVFPPLNLLIQRTVDYNEAGRYQNLDQAKKFDVLLEDSLYDQQYHKVDVGQFGDIMNLVEFSLQTEGFDV